MLDFPGSYRLLFGLAGLTALFALLLVTQQAFELIPIVLIFGGATWGYWRWHQPSGAKFAVPKLPELPVKVGPSTEAETKQAQGFMHAALIHTKAYLDDGTKDPDEAMFKLEPIARALNHARALDPNATIEDEEGRTRTQDAIAAEMCWLEAYACEVGGKPLFLSSEWHDQKRGREVIERGLNAIKKALLYHPDHVTYLQMQVKLARLAGNNYLANTALERAREIDPNNPHTLALVL